MAKFLKPADGNVGLADLSKLAQVVPDPCAESKYPPLPPPPPGWGGKGIPPNQYAAMANFFTQISPAERRNWAAIMPLMLATNAAGNILNERGEIEVNNLFVNNTATVNNLNVAMIQGHKFFIDIQLGQVRIGDNQIVLGQAGNISGTATADATVYQATGAFNITGFTNTSPGGGVGSAPTTATNPRGHYITSGQKLWLSYNSSLTVWEVADVVESVVGPFQAGPGGLVLTGVSTQIPLSASKGDTTNFSLSSNVITVVRAGTYPVTLSGDIGGTVDNTQFTGGSIVFSPVSGTWTGTPDSVTLALAGYSGAVAGMGTTMSKTFLVTCDAGATVELTGAKFGLATNGTASNVKVVFGNRQ